MKFEDRVQLKLLDLTEELFEKIVAYGFRAPSGIGGPGCVIMISEDGRSYQFYGPELNNLNYYREWASLFPVLNQCDTRQWKLAENDDCIQTCDVTIFKSDSKNPVLLPEKEWFDVDVISCAAPNLRCMSQHNKHWKKNVTDQDLLDIYKKRINRVLDIARYAKSEVVILGAFGCGAFANPPELVVSAMNAAINEHKYDFETIELAIYCSPRDTSNYEVFAKEFSA